MALKVGFVAIKDFSRAWEYLYSIELNIYFIFMYFDFKIVIK